MGVAVWAFPTVAVRTGVRVAVRVAVGTSRGVGVGVDVGDWVSGVGVDVTLYRSQAMNCEGLAARSRHVS